MALASPSAVPTGAGVSFRRRALTAAWIAFGVLCAGALAAFGWAMWRCITATMRLLDSLSRLSVVIDEGLAALDVTPPATRNFSPPPPANSSTDAVDANTPTSPPLAPAAPGDAARSLYASRP